MRKTLSKNAELWTAVSLICNFFLPFSLWYNHFSSTSMQVLVSNCSSKQVLSFLCFFFFICSFAVWEKELKWNSYYVLLLKNLQRMLIASVLSSMCIFLFLFLSDISSLYFRVFLSTILNHVSLLGFLSFPLKSWLARLMSFWRL